MSFIANLQSTYYSIIDILMHYGNQLSSIVSGIGCDAKVALDIHNLREENPEKFYNQVNINQKELELSVCRKLGIGRRSPGDMMCLNVCILFTYPRLAVPRFYLSS